MKLIKTPIDEETVLKVSKSLSEIVGEEMGFRKILFKFLRENLSSIEHVDKSAWRKLREGYGKDLSNKRMSDLTEEVILWKKAKTEICKDCIIISNCSKICQRLRDRYSEVHEKHSKETWDGQKGKM